MYKTLTYSMLCNRFLGSGFQLAWVICGVTALRTKGQLIRRMCGLCDKEILLLSAAGVAGPDVQLSVRMCFSFFGVAGGMVLAYAGRNRREPRRLYQ